MVVLSYCSPMEIQRALQQPHNTTINILAIVAVVDASDHRPYYPDEIWEVALMDDRYVSNMVFDEHEFTYLQYQNLHPSKLTSWNQLVIKKLVFQIELTFKEPNRTYVTVQTWVNHRIVNDRPSCTIWCTSQTSYKFSSS
jgi:hypothetical protein